MDFASEYYDYKERRSRMYLAHAAHVNVTHHHGCRMCGGAPARRDFNRGARCARRKAMAQGNFDFDVPTFY